MSEPQKLKCKNCGCDNHPHYDYKYDGFCLDCVNAKADQHLDKIAELERQLAAAQAKVERMEAALNELSCKWRKLAFDSRDEAGRIRRTIKEPTDAEERCNVRAEVWDKCADDLSALQPDARNWGEGE